MALPYIKFYPGDFKRDTADLTFDQRAAYWELLQHQWAKGSVPDDDGKLARIIGITEPRWQRMKAEVLAFFDRVDGRWVQKRMATDRGEALRLSDIRRASGYLGGKAMSLKDKIPLQANAKQMVKQTGVGVITDSPTGTEVKKESLNPCSLDHEFAQIVTLYPRRTHRQEGRLAYFEARKGGATFREIVEGIARLQATLPDDPQFIPSLPKWLLGERWKDEPMAPAPRKRDRTQEVLDKLKEQYGNEPAWKESSADIIDISSCRKAE